MQIIMLILRGVFPLPGRIFYFELARDVQSTMALCLEVQRFRDYCRCNILETTVMGLVLVESSSR